MPEIHYVDPWGFSKLDTYSECPARFKYQFIDKLLSPSSPALERGNAIHGHIEFFLRDIDTELNQAVKYLRTEIAELKALSARPESAWGFDEDWKWLHNWLLPATWLRVKLDAHLIQGDKAQAIDFKTGKHRPASEEQVQLYALAMFAKYPKVNEVTAELWYVDNGVIDTHNYLREDEDWLRTKFKKRVEPMYKDTVFAPKPSRLCGWCPYSRSQDNEHGEPGPCKY